MTREKAKEIWPVMMAYSEGEDVQYGANPFWNNATDPTFTPDAEWRVKPKPLEHWVVVDQEGQIISCRFTSYKHAMDYTVEYGIKNYRIVHFREVV